MPLTFPSVPQVSKLSTVAKGPIPYVANAARKHQASQGPATCEDFCSDLARAGWQFDCFQAVALRERVHAQGVDSRVRDFHLGEHFTALKRPMANVARIPA